MAMARLTALLGRPEPEAASNGEPAGIRVSRETISGETVLNVVVTAPRYKPWFSGVAVGVPAVVMLVALVDSNYWFISLFCLAWVLPALLVVVPDLRTPREIDITRKFITFSDAVAGGGGSSETIPVPSVRAIDIVKARRNVGEELIIRTDDGEIRFGSGLAKESLGWLSEYLWAAIRNA